MKSKKKLLTIVSRLVYGKKNSSESYIEYLRARGAKIGEDVYFHSSTTILIDDTQPFLITIGNNVQITAGVKILTHDYSWYVIKNFNGNIYGANRPTIIGNNVFIGMNSVILSGSTISDNIIIGAGSVVSGKLEQAGVYAGNPARYIMSLEEYEKKRNDLQIKEAKELAISYYERFHKKPYEEIFHEYFFLFSDLKHVEENEVFRKKIQLGNGAELSKRVLEEHKPAFNSYDAFLDYCFKDIDNTGDDYSE